VTRDERGPGLRRILGGLAVATFVLSSAGCTSDGEIQHPAPLYGDVPIQYPIQLWDQDQEGETLLRVRVTDTGTVDSVVVEKSSGYAAFDSAAVAGAKKLQFSPARRKGKRIRVWAEVPVNFSKKPRPDTLPPLPDTLPALH